MLKKYSFIVIVVLFSVSIINAQKLTFGVFVNPGFSWMNTDINRIQADGSKFGINFGIMADKYFSNHYAFATGLSLHSIGGVLKYDEQKILTTGAGTDTLPPGARVHYNLQYIHIPWALKFKTTEIGYMTFFAQLGLNTMINVKARANVRELDIQSESVSKEINLFYMAYHISGGVEYKIVGNTSLVAGISYMNGFTDITQQSSEKTVMHCFDMRLGVLF